jgi:hypothetical protein
MQLKIGKCFFGLGILLTLGLGSNAFAKTFKGSGSDSFTFSGSDYTYFSDYTGFGTDNLNGNFLLGETGYSTVTATTCTAPDGTPGYLYANDSIVFVKTYTDGSQLFGASTSPENTYCSSSTTGSGNGTYTVPWIGGSGKYAGATGTISITFTIEIFSSSGPAGSNGGFGAEQWTISGSVTVPKK